MTAKSKRFNRQNNNFARAEFTCSTLCRHCTTTTWKSQTRRLWRTETDVNTTLRLNFSFPFLNRVPSPRFQFQANITTFDNQNEFSCNNYDKLQKTQRLWNGDVFAAVTVVVPEAPYCGPYDSTTATPINTSLRNRLDFLLFQTFFRLFQVAQWKKREIDKGFIHTVLVENFDQTPCSNGTVQCFGAVHTELFES